MSQIVRSVLVSLASLSLLVTLPAQVAGKPPQSSSQPAAAAPASPPAKRQPPKPAAAAAPGGGPGQVWVNLSSSVYHCFGDRFYGKTAHGRYMTEAAAKAAGAHGVGGKTCSAAAK